MLFLGKVLGENHGKKMEWPFLDLSAMPLVKRVSGSEFANFTPQMKWGCDPLAGARGRNRPAGPPPPQPPSGLHPPFGPPPLRQPLFPSAAASSFSVPPPKIPDTSLPPPVREPAFVDEGVSNTNEEVMFPKGKTAELQSFLEKSSDKTLIGKLNSVEMRVPFNSIKWVEQ